MQHRLTTEGFDGWRLACVQPSCLGEAISTQCYLTHRLQDWQNWQQRVLSLHGPKRDHVWTEHFVSPATEALWNQEPITLWVEIALHPKDNIKWPSLDTSDNISPTLAQVIRQNFPKPDNIDALVLHIPVKGSSFLKLGELSLTATVPVLPSIRIRRSNAMPLPTI
jgi:hypothetical protein